MATLTEMQKLIRAVDSLGFNNLGDPKTPGCLEAVVIELRDLNQTMERIADALEGDSI